VRVGLGAKVAGVNVVELVEMLMDADPLQNAASVGRIAVGEDELAARQPGESGRQARVGRDPIERDRMDVLQEIVRVDVALLHQAGQRRPMLMEMSLLDAFRFGLVAIHQPLDIGAHALVDQREQAGRGRIEAIVEIEDPVADMCEARVHGPGGA
jgi:hypothetical protein